MRVTHLKCQGLYSFGYNDNALNLDLSSSDSGLTVVVGPNASGKSNLGALIDLVISFVKSTNMPASPMYYDRFRVEWLSDVARYVRHHDLPEGTEMEVRLGIELTTSYEKDILASFMRAAIASSPGLPSSGTGSGDDRTSQWYQWISKLDTSSFDSLFRGDLIVSHSGTVGSEWKLAFEPASKINRVNVRVEFGQNFTILVRKDGLRNASPPYDDRLGIMICGKDGIGASFPEPNKVLGRLVPQKDANPTSLLARFPGTTLPFAPVPLQKFVELASLETIAGANTAWGIGVVWERILRKGIRHLHAQDSYIAVPDNPTVLIGEHRYTAADLSEPAGLGVKDLFRRLWELHNSDPPSDSLKNIQEEFKELTSGWRFTVASTLAGIPPLELKAVPDNGESMTSNYSTVHAAPSETPSEERDIVLRVQVYVYKQNNEDKDKYRESLDKAGTGAGQSLVLAELLGNSANQFVFLDEPATNLHPSWQRHIRERIEKLAADSSVQFLMVTHSPTLTAPIQHNSPIPVRMSNNGVCSCILQAPKELPNEWHKDLSLSPEGWGLLFADKVLLVEGDTEFGALPIWFAKVADDYKHPAWLSQNIAISNVGGHNSFRSWGRYLSYYQIPWAVVCDGIILDPYIKDPDNTSHTSHNNASSPPTYSCNENWILLQVADAKDDKQLSEKAIEQRKKIRRSREHPDKPTFEEVKDLANCNGIFTLANQFTKPSTSSERKGGARESIDDLIENDPILKQRKDEGGCSSKVRTGIYVARDSDPPDEIKALYCDISRYFSNSNTDKP